MTDDSPKVDRARKLAALRGSERVLSGSPLAETAGERLARLAAEAGAGQLDQGVDVYGDGLVAELERRGAELLGMEAAAFFPTGTMAQQVALRCWAGRTGSPTVALHPLSHLEVHERGAYAQLSGLRAVHPTSRPRLPTAAEIRAFEEPFGTLALELPLRDAGFVLPSWAELTEVVAAARERDAVVHFDGARLWECTSHFGVGLAEIAALADSVYVSFYKSLGGLSGALLAGPAELVEEAAAWRHRYGGRLFQQWPAALSALSGLDRELPRLPSYVAHAKVVAGALREAFGAAGVSWYRVHPEEPHTHQFQVWLPYPAAVLEEAGVLLAEREGTWLFHSWRPGPVPGLSFTEVTVGASALDWTAAAVGEAVGVLLELVRGGG
ncbi:threonine aldolase family protein [Streptomyces orinoci]|uniref:Beta-eliminating lyase-related protein n=1 Tax=Streptomyces orinoci TaxID=67339 RepID=A0ABV3JYL9_STRON|nr:beta-eliminating lyase-related protein [Streptomyces orinoci]